MAHATRRYMKYIGVVKTTCSSSNQALILGGKVIGDFERCMLLLLVPDGLGWVIHKLLDFSPQNNL